MSCSRSISLIIALAALLCCARPGLADIRTWRDSDGKVHLSNIDMPDLPAFRGSNKITRSQPVRRSYSVPRAGGYSATGRYDELIHDAAERFGVDYRLIKAVIHAESAFDHRAVSRKGAQGLMQLMPSTARDLRVSDPFDPRQNVYGGTRYLKQMLQRYDNDVSLSLAAYNSGPSTVERYGGVPPYRETVSYIRKVKSLMNRYDREPAPRQQADSKLYKVVKNGREMYSSSPLP
jgi:soluble lytic murein transglycosylase